MELTDDEILEAADRIREQRGLKVVRECAQCGASFAAASGERFCTPECQNAAAHEQDETEVSSVSRRYFADQRPDESIRDYWVRTSNGRPLRDDEIEKIDVLELIQAYWAEREPLTVDSTELIRQGREERLKQFLEQ